MKRKLLYPALLLLVLFLIWLSDEGSEPLVLKGTDLEQQEGVSDYTGVIGIDETAQYYGLFARTDDYVLNKGTYSIRLEYSATADENILEVWDNGTRIAQWFPDSTAGAEQTKDFVFTLDKDSQQLHIRVYFSGTGSLTLRTLSLVPEGSFYNDARFLAALAVLLILTAMLLDGYWKRHPVSRERKLTLLILAGLCLYASTPLFIQSFKQTDDICYHLLRIEGIKDGMLDGQFPVVIYPEALSGNGYLNSMYPYLFLYIPAFLRLFGVSLALSYKFLIVLANVATVALTWKAFRLMAASRYACLLGTALYILLPYRFTNIYARGALGETLAMTFLPIVIAGFYLVLVGNHKKWPWLVLGFTGLVESHVLSTAYMALIFAVCCLFFIRVLLREKRWLSLLKAAGLTAVLNLWFLVPFLYFYLKENLYTKALDWSGFAEYSINASFLLDTFHTNDYRFLSLGLPVLGLAAVCVLWIFVEKKAERAEVDRAELSLWDERNGFLTFLFWAACALTFLVTGYFGKKKLTELVPVLETAFRTIQFPWRLLAPAGILFIFVGAIWLSGSRVLRPYRSLIFAFLVGVNLLTCLNQPYNQNNFAYLDYDDTTTVGHQDKIIGIPKSDATVIYPYEWRIDALTDDKLTAELQLSDAQKVTVTGYEKKGTSAVLTYQTEEEGQYVDFPIQKYLGYRAEDENGNELKISYGNNYRIRVLLTAGGEHTIRVFYSQPAGFRISQAVSLFGLLGCIAYAVRRKRDEKKAAALY